MSSVPTINVPIALSCRPSATLTLPWFPQCTEYGPKTATFQPLVNGEETFGAVYDAIDRARHTVDIICWGFQPSMYFKRGAQGQGSVPIGQLLADKGHQGVKVRLLCWFDPLHLTDLFSENMQPGNNLRSRFADATWLSRDPRNSTQREFDLAWYRRASLNDVNQSMRETILRVDPVFGAAALIDWARHHKPFPNLEIAVRNFGLWERARIAWHTVREQDDGQTRAARALNSMSLELEPTHHQKTVLVDYEDPERATGFVMGHNMLDEYWDTGRHSAMRSHPQMGRNGFHARQDISSRVRGPILQDLNTNFCSAWDRATGQQLAQARERAKDRLKLPDAGGDTRVMAQVLRTQSQEGMRDIKKMYLQAVNNVASFVYIENQYFRWQPLADKIKDAVQKQIKAGRDPAQHGSVYLFVVTNDNDEGIGDGTANTYHMLNALGQADAIPAVAHDMRASELAQQRQQLEEQLAWDRNSDPSFVGLGVDPGSAYARQVRQQHAEHLAKQQALRQQIAEVDKQIAANQKEPIASLDIDGLKVIVCSLVPPDTPAGEPWPYTYVHAKLMIVDDVFMTLGSANINKRSMEADSELNICHEHGGVTAPLRQKLWDMHTGGLGAQKAPAEAFKEWGRIVRRNDRNRQKHLAPEGALVKFNYAGNKISYQD